MFVAITGTGAIVYAGDLSVVVSFVEDDDMRARLTIRRATPNEQRYVDRQPVVYVNCED